MASPEASVVTVKSSAVGVATCEQSPIASDAIANEATNEVTRCSYEHARR